VARRRLVLVGLLAVAASGQYPPGQYPPGTAGGPGGISLPMPKLPGRKSKDKDTSTANGNRVALRAAEGTLRELGEKDLYLETTNHKLLKFRTLAKTQFQNKKGEQVRDSLLKPGDQLSVQVNDDDPETAVRVVLTRAGTEAERTAAGRPFDHESAKAPLEADTHSAGTMQVATAPPVEAKPDTSRNSDPELPATVNPAPAEQTHTVEDAKTVPLADRPDEDIITAARDAADHLNDGLPNFIVQQNTSRYYTTTQPARWRTVDVVTAEVVSVGGKEEYRNIMVNGKASTQPVEKSGSWSTGEFQTTLETLLSRYTAADFRRANDVTLGGRPAYAYHFSVRQIHSTWEIRAEDGSKATPAYSGTIWIDKGTHNVMRIEEQAGPLPSGFPFDKAETVIEYSFIRIDGNTYPLPAHSEILTCQRGSSTCTKNDINFQNYRRFGADSTVTFGK
jgi:hypothetical protein